MIRIVFGWLQYTPYLCQWTAAPASHSPTVAWSCRHDEFAEPLVASGAGVENKRRSMGKQSYVVAPTNHGPPCVQTPVKLLEQFSHLLLGVELVWGRGLKPPYLKNSIEVKRKEEDRGKRRKKKKRKEVEGVPPYLKNSIGVKRKEEEDRGERRRRKRGEVEGVPLAARAGSATTCFISSALLVKS